MNSLKEMLIQSTYQILGSILIIWGIISIANHIGWLGSFVLMFAALFAWSILVMLWRIRVKGR